MPSLIYSLILSKKDCVLYEDLYADWNLARIFLFSKYVIICFVSMESTILATWERLPMGRVSESDDGFGHLFKGVIKIVFQRSG